MIVIFIFFILFILFYKFKENFSYIEATNPYNILDTKNNMSILKNLNSDVMPYDKKNLYNITYKKTKFEPLNIDSLPQKVKYYDNIYNLLGSAINSYYKQHYYIYEHKFKSDDIIIVPQDNMKHMNNLYEYILIKPTNNKFKVIHYINPRNKININDIVNISSGVFQLGPLVIKKN
jgi:hypothetical protein